MQKETVPIILASGSPRRRQLLQTAGVAFSVHSVEVDESTVVETSPSRLVMKRARLKAEAAAASLGPGVAALVVGADTIVVLGDDVLGKPADGPDAGGMLARLSNRSHRVLTGLAVCPTDGWTETPSSSKRGLPEEAERIGRAGRTLVSFQETNVTMGPLDPQTIARYVATGEPLDKAGAYGIQGRGGLLVRRIEGDYFNVVGLPLALLRDMVSLFEVELLG